MWIIENPWLSAIICIASLAGVYIVIKFINKPALTQETEEKYYS